MKNFRQVAFIVIAALSVLSFSVFMSCKDKCGSTTCANGGTCTDNVCVCPTGYSGSSCGTAWTDKFVTTYNCYRGTCTPENGGTATWTSAITKDATNGGYTVDISNFAGSNVAVVGTVDSLTTMVFAPPAGSYGISGHATLFSGDTIKVDYTLSTASGAGQYSCNFIMVRQ